MAAAVPFLLIASTAMTAVSAIGQARAARAQGDYNAAVAERNAAVAREQAAADAEAQQRHARQVIGAARANYGASGITMEGSPLDVLAMSAANAELDRRNILYRGELQAMGYGETAALDRARGRAGERAGYLRAGSAVLMGAGRYYGNQPTTTPTSGYTLGAYDYSYDGL